MPRKRKDDAADRPPLHQVAGGLSAVAWPAENERSRPTRLSHRERIILQELARGQSTEEIAATMYVSPHTVRTHIKNGMRKLDARTRAHAVALALSEGVIEPTESTHSPAVSAVSPSRASWAEPS